MIFVLVIFKAGTAKRSTATERFNIMRTTVFFGLMIIAEAIISITNAPMDDDSIVFGSVLLVVIILMDLIDFFKSL